MESIVSEGWVDGPKGYATHIFLTARINRLNEYANQGKTDTYAVVIAETTCFSTNVAFIDGVPFVTLK